MKKFTNKLKGLQKPKNKAKKVGMKSLIKYLEYHNDLKGVDIAKKLGITRQNFSRIKQSGLTKGIQNLIELKRSFELDWETIGEQLEKDFDEER